MPVLTPSSQSYQAIVDTIKAAINNPPPRVDEAEFHELVPKDSAQYAEGLITLKIKQLSLDHCMLLHSQLSSTGPLHDIYGKINMVSVISALQERAIAITIAIHPHRNGNYKDVIVDHDRFPIEATFETIKPLMTSMESGYSIHYRALKSCVTHNAPPIGFMDAMQQDLQEPAQFEPSPGFTHSRSQA